MSTRGSVWCDDYDPMDWQPPPPKPWCPSCCVPLNSCGCPEAERLLDETHLIRGED